jgi:outer membrane protein assembly factor BamB
VNQGSRFDPDFSGSDRDVVQYVFWGKDSLINAPCRINTLVTPNTNKTYDDNRHDTVNQIWAYDSGSRRVSSPAVDGSDPANVKIYTGRSSDTTQNDAGRLLRLNPSNGTTDSPGWERNPDTTSGNDDDMDSSPALDSSGDIYIGNDSSLISRYNSSGTKVWSTPLFGNIEGKPFVSDAKDRIYVVTDKNPSFDAMLFSLNKSGTVQWFVPIGTTDGDYTSSPVVRYDSTLDKNFIYVGSLNRSLYIVRDDGGSPFIVRQFSIPSGPIRSTPAINPVTNDVYFGSDDNNIYAITSAGNGRWAILTGDDVVSSPAVAGDGRTVYVGSNNGRFYIISLNIDGTLNSTQTYPPSGDSPIGAIQSSPTIASDGAIIFGSDDGHLYTLNPDGTLRWKYPAVGSIAAVRSKPAIGPDGIIYFGAEDGKLYAIDPSINDPPNIPNLYLTPAQLDPTGLYGNNWFTEGPWAVRVEVERSQAPNVSGKYEYTLKTWMKKCQDAGCSNVVGKFYQNTRFEYDWANESIPITPMTQTIELSNESPDFFHDRFDRFLFGFTSASTDPQTIEIRKFQLSFIRPNDPVAND